MTNIWGFLLQTITVSLAAALLLVVKELLSDKLSPRWQYGVWGVLALRILMPVYITRDVLLHVPLWVETWKGAAERTLSSAYTAQYSAVQVRWPFPVLAGRPMSVTDWLFVLYAAGVFFTLAWYLASYLRLWLLLRRGSPVSEETRARIQSVCDAYSLRSCQAVTVAGLPCAFVCGLLRPVMALPADAETSDKVLLHELMHLKYRDALQSAVWCVFRALHWCNPFLQYVFNRVGNDMESLCDQRVLERLEGEERREYGAILLSMANDRYPRAPGTTSVSNGGKNIARRIAAIVRFKKYPAGMGLASVCIALSLALQVLAGTAAGYGGDYYHPGTNLELERAMALARIQRCTTVAGALDTYAKGLIYENGVYIAMASPLARQGEIEKEMRRSTQDEGRDIYHLDVEWRLGDISQNDGYKVCNLEKRGDGSYTATLAFQVTGLLTADGEDLLRDENGEAYGSGSVVVPVTVKKEDGWSVTISGPPGTFPARSLHQVLAQDKDLLWLKYYKTVGRSGTVSAGINTIYTVNNMAQSNGMSFFGGSVFDETVKPDAQFDNCEERVYIKYNFGGGKARREKLSYAAMELAIVYSPGDKPAFTGRSNVGDSVWGSSDGTAGCGRTITADWDGTLTFGSGGGADMKNGLAELPAGYAVRVYLDGEAVEDFNLEEAD